MKKKIISVLTALAVTASTAMGVAGSVYAAETAQEKTKAEESSAEESGTGGGYAVTGQLEGSGYTTKLYNADNGLPTSDANCIMADHEGYIWVGGYSGVFKYDGDTFQRLDSNDGLANARTMFEDSKERIWVGTNDSGVVLLEASRKATHITYKDGIPSSSIRGFGETLDGDIYVGSTNGVFYIDRDLAVHVIEDSRMEGQYVEYLGSDSSGRIYGCTRNKDVFAIEDGKVTVFMTTEDLDGVAVTDIFADPVNPDMFYLGTDTNLVYYGILGNRISTFEKIDVAPAENIYDINYACGRIWVDSSSVVGYLDETNRYQVVDDLPLTDAIEMMTSDYQGNLWFASTRQGIMKVVSSNFQDITELSALESQVVNATCIRDNILYVATDSGLQTIHTDLNPVKSEITKYIGDSRVRCLLTDSKDNLWIATYTNNLGLVEYTPSGEIISFTEKNGLISNEVRCICETSDGKILAGSNGGLTIIKDGRIERQVGAAEGMSNTVLLTVCEGEDGAYYCGSDGDGIYVVTDEVKKISRDDGLTSDVILRVKYDSERDVYWIITSNSIEYMTPDGTITNVDTFPYNNNFDIYYGQGDKLWILSSYGVYCVDAADMIKNEILDYRLYNSANGLPSIPTGNAYSALDGLGFLYISGRSGVSRVNIDHYFEHDTEIRLGVKSIITAGGEILPDENGHYRIPADAGRIQINPAILDFSLSNPTVKVYLEGSDDPGITSSQRDMTPLEFSELKYGDYNLHVQVINAATGDVYQDEVFGITKIPQLHELLFFRVLLVAILILLAGLIVWRVMTGTIIRRQYEQIRQAKDEADRANTAKSRFLANMSHEIRTPINTIMGMDEMILREDATDVPKPYFQSVVGYALDIKNATDSLLSLVNDLLDLSKIESGKMHLVEQDYDVKDLLRAIVSMIKGRAQQKDLAFDVDVDQNLPSVLHGDDGKVKQIILNLLTNAVKYTDKGGFKLTVSVAEQSNELCSIRVSVKDTGIGVKPEDMDKLFTAYERLDEEKNSGIQGTGLGLDISRQFALLMGGALWCESEYGNGSEFIFTFDQKVSDSTPIGKFSKHEEKMAKGPYVPQFIAPDADVLVVDDNPMNLTVIKGLLKATKMFVTTAASGEECLEKLKYGNFNVVLLDHMMPGMDGLETCAHIRETMPDLPVYALTANATAGGDEFYKSKGFNGYLAKPIDSLALEKAIMKHLPKEIMMKATEADAVQEATELSEEYKWVYEAPGISVEDGIRNSGGVESYVYSLNLFYDTLENNADVIENAYNESDIRLYTVKVHALKTSARFIGAMELSKLAEQLEEAGNKNDMDLINEKTPVLLDDFKSFKTILAQLHPKDAEDSREPIPEEELKEAYAALAEVIPMMDYDAVEMIIEQLQEYKLPEEDEAKVTELNKHLKMLEWDKMKELI